MIATGDLVLESNRGSPEAIERWFRFYDDLSNSLGVPVYSTIGNNEIAGIENDAFPESDPRYGRHFFHAFVGPSHYSFDRGAFHFVALDTHRPLADEAGWTFGRMPDGVRDWLDADLAAHSGRVPVVLNHEPFHFDPAWPFSPDPAQMADDEGLFAKHGVRYALSGHTHQRSFLRRDGVVHLTTGALSGLRWVLPATVHERGYRLFYARDGQLHSGWKRTGEPLVSWSEGAERDGDRIAVVADRAGPFASVEVTRAGETVAAERWGRYFLRVPGEGAAQVTGVRQDGSRFAVELSR